MTSRRTHTALDILKLVHLGSARSHLEFHVIRCCSATLWKKGCKGSNASKDHDTLCLQAVEQVEQVCAEFVERTTARHLCGIIIPNSNSILLHTVVCKDDGTEGGQEQVFTCAFHNFVL